MVSCSGFGLPLHAQLLRLFVTRHCRAPIYLANRSMSAISLLDKGFVAGFNVATEKQSRTS